MRSMLSAAPAAPADRTMMSSRKTRSSKNRWAELSTAQRALVLALASVQVSMSAAAWTALAQRPASEVNGGKGRWAALIAINFIGPTLYFTRGVRR